MQTNQAPVWDLAGRETEMSALAQSFDRVRKGTGPQGVTILADSGVGKTRLLVEFFSQLVRHHDKNGYWPAALPQDPAALELNPRLSDFRWSETGPGNPGFWWWALRFSDPGQRNTTVSRAGAITTYAPELLPHFAFLEHKNVLVADKKGALDLGIDVLMEFGPALLGAAVPGLGLMKPILVKAVESHRIRRDLAKMMGEKQNPAEGATSRAKQTEERLLSGLLALADVGAGRTDEPAALIPLVICLDDAHWIDPDSASLLAKLLGRAVAKRLPVLVVVTAWPSEWHRLADQSGNDSVKELFQVLEHLGVSGATSERILEPCYQVDRLIESSLPGLRVEQRRAIAAKVGPDLYGLHLLVADLLDRPRLFEGEIVTGALTLEGEKRIERIEHVRLDLARDRFQDLAPGLREVLSVAASHGRTFIAALVCDVCEQLRADGWAALDGVQADGALSEARALHHYIAPASAMTAQFIDDAKFIAAKEHLQDSARALEKVRTTTLLVLSQWFQQGQFDQLSWQETQRLFDVAEWVLDAPGGAERDAHESVRASLAVRLLTLQDILGVPALDAARSAVKHASSVLELDRAAFRAALPLRWQARWLLRRATDHTLRVSADSATFLELIDAATSTLRTSVEALSKDSTWQGAEAVSNAAAAMVSLTWAAISQAGINGNTEFDETELLDETKLLDAAAHCLESGISSLLGLGSVEVAARCAMLDGLAEAAPRGTSSHHRNQAWDRLVTDLLALVQADDWSEASASLLFEGPFETALLAWPHWERSRDSYRIAQALCSATAGQPLEALGNFQLALRALALFRVCGTQVDSIEEDLASTEDCNFELINRGMAPLVHKYTWVSQVSVRVAAGTSQAVPLPEFTSQERLSLAWTSATKTLTRLFDAEVKMSMPVLVRLCERTLRPVAELYLPPRSEHAKGLAEFVGRVHALSPNSGCAPLVAAAYAWWTQASNLISASDGLTAQQLQELRFAAFEAVSLVPRRVFAALSDYDRDFKASEPFLKDLAQVPERLDREALLAQAAVACIDCRSYYSVDDFTEVTWRNLMAVFSKAAGDRASDGGDPQEPCALGQLALNLVKRFKPHDDQCSEALLVELDEFRSLALASRTPR